MERMEFMRSEFNQGWVCNGKPVTLPHDAMLEEQREADCRNGVNSGYFPGGKYTYEKAFTVGSENIGKKIVLHFEGVYQNSTIYLNGNQMGAHKYGYTAFDVDISDTAQAGENHLRVEVDNSLEPNCRWYSGSGIYRPVTLLIDELDAPKIVTKSYDPAVIEVSADADAVEIYDGGNLVASGVPGEFTIPDAKLWSAETPNLYTCVIRKDGKEHRTTFGIRLLPDFIIPEIFGLGQRTAAVQRSDPFFQRGLRRKKPAVLGKIFVCLQFGGGEHLQQDHGRDCKEKDCEQHFDQKGIACIAAEIIRHLPAPPFYIFIYPSARRVTAPFTGGAVS